eukprot:COSAG02_NODE_275_length_26232_cov_85.210424_18_plen_117_part_00
MVGARSCIKSAQVDPPALAALLGGYCELSIWLPQYMRNKVMTVTRNSGPWCTLANMPHLPTPAAAATPFQLLKSFDAKPATSALLCFLKGLIAFAIPEDDMVSTSIGYDSSRFRTT